jgi:eukaryotic-like serine/threonine-protein kinase
MGAVNHAHDVLLECSVALKILRTGGSELGSQGRERLLNEAQALARLHHPHIVAIFDAGRRMASRMLSCSWLSTSHCRNTGRNASRR